MHTTAATRVHDDASDVGEGFAETVITRRPPRERRESAADALDRVETGDIAGLREGHRPPFMPSLLRPPGAQPAATTADVVDLLAQLRAVVGLGVDLDELGDAVVDGRRGA